MLQELFFIFIFLNTHHIKKQICRNARHTHHGGYYGTLIRDIYDNYFASQKLCKHSPRICSNACFFMQKTSAWKNSVKTVSKIHTFPHGFRSVTLDVAVVLMRISPVLIWFICVLAFWRWIHVKEVTCLLLFRDADFPFKLMERGKKIGFWRGNHLRVVSYTAFFGTQPCQFWI